MHKKIKNDELNEVVGDIYWKSLEDFFNIGKEDFKLIKSRYNLYRLDRLSGSDIVLDWGAFCNCYHLINENEKKMSQSFSGALNGLNITKKQLASLDKFYEKLKSNIVNEVGKDNFLKYLGATLVDSKKFYVNEDNLTTDHFFHKSTINDVSLKEDYIKVLIKSAISVDIKRNKSYRTVMFENTIELLKFIEEDEPELFANTIENVFKHQHMKENIVVFVNSLCSDDLKKYRPDYIKVIDPVLSELKKQKIFNKENEVEVSLFQDSPVFSVSLMIENLYPLSSNYLPANSKMVFVALAKLLKETMPEYEFGSGIEDDKTKISFNFDSRFSSYETMTKVLPIFLKEHGWSLNSHLTMDNDINRKAIESIMSLVQKQTNKTLIQDTFKKHQTKDLTTPVHESNDFKI